jgi:hypothetical protein
MVDSTVYLPVTGHCVQQAAFASTRRPYDGGKFSRFELTANRLQNAFLMT